MHLKDYQIKVLERLDTYLELLRDKKGDAEDYAEFKRSRGKAIEIGHYPEAVWDELNKRRLIPTIKDQRGNEFIANHINRRDGLDYPIPNICFKVPTSGGKTLLAVNALERININLFEKQTGFVLWIVPSDTIYRQTWKAFANREHPYRQVLERASGGRVRLLEKMDSFSPMDVKEYLCVMLLMLQSSARQSKETLKVFRDSGSFSSFFPEVDDFVANEELLKQIPNLDINEIGPQFIWNGICIKHSLGNTMRLLRPVLIVDEGHRAYSETARSTLTNFNPSFMLELSATPNMHELHSNVLVDVPGTALKDEQMIKLPINIFNFDKSDWKYTLTEALDQLNALSKSADIERAKTGRYIRPLMVIRVDRTGREQQDGIHIHADDAKHFLINRLGINPDEIRIKTATVDELGDDDLLSPFCTARFIITKDALKEGWDCPFAYILSVLSKTTAPLAMTQMIGRVLRQPDATLTTEDQLNECYIYCFDQDVNRAVESVRKGIEEEGITGLKSDVKIRTLDTDIEQEITKIIVKRRKQFKGLQIFLPRIVHREGAGYRLLDYDRDILRELNWSSFSYSNDLPIGDVDAPVKTHTSMNLNNYAGQLKIEWQTTKESIDQEPEMDIPFLARQLMEIVPNPWLAARILHDCFDRLRKGGATKERIVMNRLHVLQLIKNDLQKQINAGAEKIFKSKLLSKDILFQLFSVHDLNWELAENYEIALDNEERLLTKRDGSAIERSLFDKVFESDLNSLEKPVALYLDGTATVRWWHRLIAKQDWHLQGWQRNKVYPDFLICIKAIDHGQKQMAVLETKGTHLKGNDDTKYKMELFGVLENAYKNCVETGEMEVDSFDSEHMTFRLLMQENWRSELNRIVQSA